MTLDAEDKAWLAATVRDIVRGQGSPVPTEAIVLPRLTYVQFGCAVELHADTIARKVSRREIPSNLVTFGRPNKISPAALQLFNVTPQEAKARLEARNLLPLFPPLPVSAIDKGGRPIPS